MTIVRSRRPSPGGPPASYLARQPFGRIPAFEHDGFRLYESGAITRYVDEAFPGPPLQPATARRRARMNQLLGIADGQLYPQLVWGLYVELVSKPRRGEAGDPDRVAAARRMLPTCLAALAELQADQAWLCGDRPSLADLHVAPMLDYALKVPEVAAALDRQAGLAAWWQRMASRPAMHATRPAPAG